MQHVPKVCWPGAPLSVAFVHQQVVLVMPRGILLAHLLPSGPGLIRDVSVFWRWSAILLWSCQTGHGPLASQDFIWPLVPFHLDLRLHVLGEVHELVEALEGDPLYVHVEVVFDLSCGLVPVDVQPP